MLDYLGREPKLGTPPNEYLGGDKEKPGIDEICVDTQMSKSESFDAEPYTRRQNVAARH